MPITLREKVMGVWLLLLTLLCGVLAWDNFSAKGRSATYDELTVQRLNVVEPDGKPRLIIANKPRFPAYFMEGIEYPSPPRDSGGMLFFNSEGDEIGGLAFDGGKTADGYHAGGQLAFDQFKQDQTVAIQYSDDNGKRSAGLRVWDRPEYSILPLIQMNAEITKTKSGEEAQAIRGKMLDYMKERGLPAERTFVGKDTDGSSVVKLSDKAGRARLILAVDNTGAPSLRFLDAQGKVTAQFPQP